MILQVRLRGEASAGVRHLRRSLTLDGTRGFRRFGRICLGSGSRVHDHTRQKHRAPRARASVTRRMSALRRWILARQQTGAFHVMALTRRWYARVSSTLGRLVLAESMARKGRLLAGGDSITIWYSAPGPGLHGASKDGGLRLDDGLRPGHRGAGGRRHPPAASGTSPEAHAPVRREHYLMAQSHRGPAGP